MPLCSYRVAPDARDPADALLRKRQDKHYDPLVKWFEEVRTAAHRRRPWRGIASGDCDAAAVGAGVVLASTLVDRCACRTASAKLRTRQKCFRRCSALSTRRTSG
jgi:hypothetical protein